MQNYRKRLSRLRNSSAGAALAMAMALPIVALPSGATAQQAASLGPAFQIAGEERTAIVIGNQDYEAVGDLNNARRDAEDMAAMLRDFGFTVYSGYDVNRQEFEELIRSVMLNIPDGADVVFYYTGHGLQVGKRNYLLPVDATFDDVYDLPVQSITLDRVLDALSSRGATHVSIIDSSRENPFPDAKLAANLEADVFETKAGFDVSSTPINSLVAFNTTPGAIGLDGPAGGNSPYTGAVLDTVGTQPDENLTSLFAKVRQKVYDATSGKQVTWESSTLVRPFRMRNPAFLVLDVYDNAGAELAQVDVGDTNTAGSGSGTTTTAEAAPTPPKPRNISLALRLDRNVALNAVISRDLGFDILSPRLIEAPSAGKITLDAVSGAISYRPNLTETPAVGQRSAAMGDAFRVEVGTPDGQRQEVYVGLQLEVDPCDLAAGDALDLDGVGYFLLPNEIEIDRALALCGDAVGSNPDVPRFRYQLGRAQQAAGDFEAAMENFLSAAAEGHSRALNGAAYLMSTTRINRDLVKIPLDEALANKFLDQAIAAGDPFAMHTRGQRLLRFGETAAERQRGFELMDRAVELGHTYSMNELGFYFLNKSGDHFQPERGLLYLKASSARDDIYGHNNLGLVALNGLDGKDPDLERAKIYFQRAAKGGHPFAPSSLGRMSQRGQIPGATMEDAVGWYDMSLERGDGWGGANGAWLILNGKVQGFAPEQGAIRAAKTLHLADADAKAAARELLDAQSKATLARALQQTLVELGETVTVDGAVGRGTMTALNKVLSEAGLPEAPGDAQGRLIAATKVYWARNPSRPDLF